MEHSKEIILLTGVTGYAGSHVALNILQKRDDFYKIRGFVRTINKYRKLEGLRDSFGEELFNQMEFVDGDLTDPQSIE